MEQEAVPQRLALIDIGSNTIRSVVYEWRNGRARKRYSERDYTGLIAYVRHGRLSREGTRRLCEVLAAMQRFCALCRCSQVMAFSTASLRGIANQAAVLEAVRRQTGLEILPLSAEEEMACDCQALVRAGRAQGVAFDLGGGSCQLFAFREGALETGASLPFGCLSLERRFVRRGLFPAREERHAIRQFVAARLTELTPGLLGCKPETLFAMGGTARAVLKVLKAEAGAEAFPGNCIPRRALRGFLRRVRADEAGALELLRRICPARMSTLLPGAYAMLAMAKALEAPSFTVTPLGVREGFLWLRLFPSTAPSTAS